MVRRLVTKSAAAVAADYGLGIRTARKWKHRYVAGAYTVLANACPRPEGADAVWQVRIWAECINCGWYARPGR